MDQLHIFLNNNLLVFPDLKRKFQKSKFIYNEILFNSKDDYHLKVYMYI